MYSRLGTIVVVMASVLFLGGIVTFMIEPKEGALVRESTLSVASSVAPRESVVPREGITLLFGGDMMFDRYLRTVARRESGAFLFGNTGETLASADLVIANLEGPITDQASVSETSVIGSRENYVFTFDPSVARLLHEEHIDVVNLGNNHSLNFGKEGVARTKAYLTDAGVAYFGSPLPEDERFLIRDIRGTRVALVNYNEFVWQGKEKALADIVEVRGEADVVILYTHWGTEYVPATDKMKRLAREFVDAGVDLIIGSHPHVIQETEVYQGKTIYYSLGNFIFDQYFSPETTAGLLVRATYDPATEQFSFEDIPVTLKNTGQTVLTQK